MDFIVFSCKSATVKINSNLLKSVSMYCFTMKSLSVLFIYFYLYFYAFVMHGILKFCRNSHKQIDNVLAENYV